jgi:predicted nuclease with TOPRIM domain
VELKLKKMNTKEKIMDYKNLSNKDLTKTLDELNSEFEKTKQLIIKLSNHLDFIEETYNKLNNEYQTRVGAEK